MINGKTFACNLGAHYETRHDLKQTNFKIPPNLSSMSTGFGLFRNGNLLAVHENVANSYNDAYTAISRKVVGKSARDNPKRYCG